MATDEQLAAQFDQMTAAMSKPPADDTKADWTIVILGAPKVGKYCLIERLRANRWVGGGQGLNARLVQSATYTVGATEQTVKVNFCCDKSKTPEPTPPPPAPPTSKKKNKVPAKKWPEPFADVDLVILLFSRASVASYLKLGALYEQAQAMYPGKPVVIVQNMADLISARLPNLTFPAKHGLPLYRLSAYRGTGCDEVRNSILRRLAGTDKSTTYNFPTVESPI